MRFLLLTLILLPSLLWAEVTLTTETYKVIEVQQDNGTSKLEWVAPHSILPGDKVGYRIVVNNGGDKKADDIVLNNPVPHNTVYVEGSARGANTSIVYSVDGGKTFAKPAQLFIKKNGRKVAASAKDYSNLRWLLQQPIKAGGKASVQYVVQVK